MYYDKKETLIYCISKYLDATRSNGKRGMLKVFVDNRMYKAFADDSKIIELVKANAKNDYSDASFQKLKKALIKKGYWN